MFPTKIGPLDPGVSKLHSKPTTRSLEQVKHPHNPSILHFRSPNQTFQEAPNFGKGGFGPRHTLLPPPISTEPSGGDTAPETKSRLKKLGRVSDSYHGYVSTICASKRTPIVLGINSSHPLIRNFHYSRAIFTPRSYLLG